LESESTGKGLAAARQGVLRKVISTSRAMPVFPTIILVTFILVGIFAGHLAPHDPIKTNLTDSLIPPMWQDGGTSNYPMGTDYLGRDILSRLLHGSTISLKVSFIVVFVCGGIGTVLALLSGYLGGWWDIIIMRITDMMMSLPYLLVAITLAAILGPSANNVILVLCVVGWAGYARVLRSEVIRVREGDFIRLASVAGASKIRIMFLHILPNIMNTLIIMTTLQFGTVIISEASLSFIGVGVPPPNPAWGSMLADGRDYITFAWWLCVWPGVAIVLVVLSCNLLGDWLRVRLDPKFRQL